MMTPREVLKLISSATHYLKLTVRRGVLKVINTDFFLQVEQFEDELYSDIELWQHFGFASLPPAGTEVLIVHPYASADGALAIATNNRTHRPAIAEGDAVLYGDQTGGDGPRVLCDASTGDIELHAPSGSTVNVGGDSEFLLLGETVKTDLNTFLGVLAAITPGDVTANAAALTAIKGAASALQTELANWLATKGKVT